MSRLTLACSLLLLALSHEPAFSSDAVMPLDRYNTDKARELAKTYAEHLRGLSETIPRCYPWVFIPKDGLGFRQPKGVMSDDRYLAVWVWVEQYYTPEFAAISREGRASAMFQRYGPDLLKRLASHPRLLADTALRGFAVILTWQKPVASLPRGTQPLGETLAVFVDRDNVVKLLQRQLSLAEFVKSAVVSGFEGKQELGPVPLTLREEPQLLDLVSPSPPEHAPRC